VILSYGEIMLDDLPSDSPHREAIEMILAAGESAASLTRQLLAFSRRQVVTLEDLDLNAVIDAILPMLRRLIGEDITLSTRFKPSLGWCAPTGARSSRC
jgi:two-component system cell cycle sensor histidine kinase/response regulator CckA